MQSWTKLQKPGRRRSLVSQARGIQSLGANAACLTEQQPGQTQSWAQCSCHTALRLSNQCSLPCCLMGTRQRRNGVTGRTSPQVQSCALTACYMADLHSSVCIGHAVRQVHRTAQVDMQSSSCTLTSPFATCRPVAAAKSVVAHGQYQQARACAHDHRTAAVASGMQGARR
jgi:hypothetical protein